MNDGKIKCCFCGVRIDRDFSYEILPIRTLTGRGTRCCLDCKVSIVDTTKRALSKKVTKIRCKKCGSIIFSKTPHIAVRCQCGAVAIDGGIDYTKITGNESDWEYIKDETDKEEVWN